jgi:hypothetical protein
MFLNGRVRVEPCMVNLILKAIFGRCNSLERTSNFHEFWSEELHLEK